MIVRTSRSGGVGAVGLLVVAVASCSLLLGCGGIVCEGSCACDGQACTCSGTGDCTVECLRPECTATCATSGDCELTVGEGTSVACDGAGVCRVGCEGSCTVGCTGGGICRVECAEGADCDLQFCPVAVVSCGNVQVCGGPCTG